MLGDAKASGSRELLAFGGVLPAPHLTAGARLPGPRDQNLKQARGGTRRILDIEPIARLTPRNFQSQRPLIFRPQRLDCFQNWSRYIIPNPWR